MSYHDWFSCNSSCHSNQIPFYPIKKFLALLILASILFLQSALWIFYTLSPFSGKFFYPSFFLAQAVNPFGLKGHDAETNKKISSYITCIPLGVTQICASIATVITAVTLLQQRKSLGSANLTRSRTVGSVKVFLTNISSLFYGLCLGTPIMFLIPQGASKGYFSEKDGWISFYFPVIFPLLSSVWNPVVYITLTKKSREQFLSLFTVIQRGSGVGPQM